MWQKAQEFIGVLAEHRKLTETLFGDGPTKPVGQSELAHRLCDARLPEGSPTLARTSCAGLTSLRTRLASHATSKAGSVAAPKAEVIVPARTRSLAREGA